MMRMYLVLLAALIGGLAEASPKLLLETCAVLPSDDERCAPMEVGQAVGPDFVGVKTFYEPMIGTFSYELISPVDAENVPDEPEEEIFWHQEENLSGVETVSTHETEIKAPAEPSPLVLSAEDFDHRWSVRPETDPEDPFRTCDEPEGCLIEMELKLEEEPQEQ